MLSADLFDVLRRRHACRHFQSKRVPPQVLDRLVYAAHRAPTGGNTPCRFVIVVDDPLTLRRIRLVTPGLERAPSAALVICTNLKTAEQGLGALGVDQCSLYDAGAAAENVVLAAYALGLGASFIKSYSETGLKRILNLPEGFRTELLVSLGYPAEDEPPALKTRKGGNLTYHDKYGQNWEISDPGASSAGEEAMVDSDDPQQYIFELSLFLLTAARGCVTEPKIYGSLRLVEAVSKLMDLRLGTVANRDLFLIQMKKKLDRGESIVMSSEAAFLKFMDDLIVEFINELESRYAGK
jgi:nitroreductase